VQPFGNTLVTFTLTGAQLDALLEQQFTAQGDMVLGVSQGFSYTWNALAPLGNRVSDIRIGGKLVEPSQEIRVTSNNFVAEGGDGFTVARQGTSRLPGADDLMVLEAYLGAHSPLAAPVSNRITRVEQP
jgi:5'-nucleotidase